MIATGMVIRQFSTQPPQFSTYKTSLSTEICKLSTFPQNFSFRNMNNNYTVQFLIDISSQILKDFIHIIHRS